MITVFPIYLSKRSRFVQFLQRAIPNGFDNACCYFKDNRVRLVHVTFIDERPCLISKFGEIFCNFFLQFYILVTLVGPTASWFLWLLVDLQVSDQIRSWQTLVRVFTPRQIFPRICCTVRRTRCRISVKQTFFNALKSTNPESLILFFPLSFYPPIKNQCCPIFQDSFNLLTAFPTICSKQQVNSFRWIFFFVGQVLVDDSTDFCISV